MSKIKISYRSPVVWNMMAFIFFSFFFLFLQSVYQNTSSILEKTMLSNFILSNKGVVILYGFSVFLIYRLSRFAIYFYWLTVLLTFGLTLLNLSNEFSKFIIILLFFYLLFAFYLHQFFIQDRSESYYNSLFTEKDLFKPMCKQIDVIVTARDGKELQGHLTNWSDEGFFVFLNTPDKLSGKVTAKILYKDIGFECRALIVSKLKTQRGYGLKVIRGKSETKLGWLNFMGIIKEMGFKPELLR